MNALEHELQYPFDKTLAQAGTKFRVSDGIYWVRMPLPFALDHINLYLVEDELDGRLGWTLIDCGVESQEIRDHWETIFAQHLEGLPILRIICTHMHPDHLGLAGWIAERFKAPLWMTLGEYMLGRVLSMKKSTADGGIEVEQAEDSASHFERHGLSDAAMLAGLRERNKSYFASLVPDMPKSFRRIRGDEPIVMGRGVLRASWQVFIGSGHSPEHASLYSAVRGVLFSGDMVLPRISTNVSVFELEPEANSVQWYLDSLKAYAACAEDTLVLPSHGRPFKGLHTRIAQQVAHHGERLQMLLDALTADSNNTLNAYQAMKLMFNRDFDLHQTTFAMGEALAHLHALWFQGNLERVVSQAGSAQERIHFKISSKLL